MTMIAVRQGQVQQAPRASLVAEPQAAGRELLQVRGQAPQAAEALAVRGVRAGASSS